MLFLLGLSESASGCVRSFPAPLADLKSAAFGRTGSSPVVGITLNEHIYSGASFFPMRRLLENVALSVAGTSMLPQTPPIALKGKSALVTSAGRGIGLSGALR
jgi:hypothetical protein